MKKTLALVLAFALVFSTMTVAFAEDAALSADAKVCADLGMLVGDGNGVTAAYTATAPNRLTAAIMFLRLKGLEADAKAFTGEANFADADKATWAKPIMAYLKANPQLGWQGDGTNFSPTNPLTAKEYYKVMLQALGYVQSSATVAGGDFSWDNVIEFAATKGLTKAAAVATFTINDVAAATVETLKANMKEGGKTLVAALVAAGKVDNAKAVAAGLVTVAPATVAVALDDVYAVGNAVVVVEYEDDVDAAAAGIVANYAIEGLEIKAATVSASDTVVLDTAVMTAGKLYTLTVGGKSLKFTGIAKVSGAPEIEKVVSEDVEEVVITFTKHIDLATGTNVANYSIAGVEIAKAEVDENEVTLTTVGLANKTKYTVKVTNVKSVDGTTKKTDSDSFTSKFDTAAPKVLSAVPETNQRIVVTFNEEVTEATAENLANYALKVDEKDGASLEIVSVTWDGDDEDFVEIVTEPMEKNEDYVVSVNGIADQRKAANTMTRPSTEDFKGADEDEDAPKLASTMVLSPTTILVKFTDDSRIDEATATDLNNYTLEDLDVESVSVVEDEYQLFRVLLTVEEMEDGESYDLAVADVADEFGNAMDEDKEVVRVTSTNVQAAKVTNTIAKTENTIIVVFSAELDEDSAENISNYTIDEDLGAPTKAVYEYKDVVGTSAKDYVVTLTVNDMVNGYENNTGHPDVVYDLTVDGVLDLAGNELYYETTVDTVTNSWDTEAADLEDVEIVNNKVVALTFDEKVLYGASAQLILAINDNEANTIALVANDRTEDDTVVEFAYAATLTEGVSFSVYKIVYNNANPALALDGGITDLKGNHLLVTDIDRQDFAFEGTIEAPEALEIDSYFQKDAKTFEVKMPRNVIITGGDNMDVGAFHVKYKATDHSVLRFSIDTGIIQEDTDYKLNFGAFLTDMHGLAVADEDTTPTPDETTLTGEYTDEDQPYVNEVVAKNRNTIKVVFNERMDESTLSTLDFDLRNYDLDETVTITGIADNTNNDGTIELTVTKPLEARYEYQLFLAKDKMDDIAGLKNTEDTFYFDGSNLQP